MAQSVLVLGSGGRESAIAWKLRHDGERVFVSPGNGGEQEAIPDLSTSASSLVSFCKTNNGGTVVVGPEAPLCRGLIDDISDAAADDDSLHIVAVGPSKRAAEIEGSKIWSKEFMTRYDLPTAEYGSFTTIANAREFIEKASWSGFVVKADGLAAGKGVVVTRDRAEATAAAKAMLQGEFGSASSRILVECQLEGFEVSALCFTDGVTVRRMPLARDHKRLLEGDVGPNTGGMGVVSPVVVSDDVERQIDEILQRSVDGMREEGRAFRGILYAGLMVSPSGRVNILEYNARFGDPETEVLLPQLDCPLLPILRSCAGEGTPLEKLDIKWKDGAHVCGIILASGGYPARGDKGTTITGIPPDSATTMVFHCGTARNDNEVFTNGGRILCVTALGEDADEARNRAIEVAEAISFDGKQFRRDIGSTLLSTPCHENKATSNGRSGGGAGMTYSSAGVDVEAGNEFVEGIKGIVGRTRRKGTEGIGGFGAVIDLASAGFSGDSQLVVGIDGVGTKIEVCDAVGKFDYVGYDVVGMCVNDVVCHCAEPLAFLDYYVCGKLDKAKATSVVASIAAACIDAGCALVGGETAEMPGVYGSRQWDVAGCAIGARGRDWPAMPAFESISVGDVVIGLASNGVHSNGFSLVRRVFTEFGIDFDSKTPWNEAASFGDVLLAPTRIYTRAVLPLMREGRVKAAAHITGGGITENAIRALPSSGSLALSVDLSTWKLPEIFVFMAHKASVRVEELLRTFNCGVGFCLVVRAEEAEGIIDRLNAVGEKAWRMGAVKRRQGADGPLITYDGLDTFLPTPSLPPVVSERKRCRVAVLVSGTGTNMEKLVRASWRDKSRAEIVAVVSNKAEAGGLELARSLRVPHVLHVPHTKDRVTGDMDLDKALRSLSIDLICLAGYMRILSPEFIALWRERILNVHPSLLPSFKGAHAVEDALAAGVKVTGCTVHYVEAAVDSGRIVAQSPVIIPEGATPAQLHALIQDQEYRLFPQAMLQAAAEIVDSA